MCVFVYVLSSADVFVHWFSTVPIGLSCFVYEKVCYVVVGLLVIVVVSVYWLRMVVCFCVCIYICLVWVVHWLLLWC